MKTTLSFTVDTERDVDILDWFESLPHGQKSAQIRSVIRHHIDPQASPIEITLLDIYREIMDLKRHGIAFQESNVGPASYEDEPEDITNTLNNLGL